jgi:hypothetical protein
MVKSRKAFSTVPLYRGLEMAGGGTGAAGGSITSTSMGAAVSSCWPGRGLAGCGEEESAAARGKSMARLRSERGIWSVKRERRTE